MGHRHRHQQSTIAISNQPSAIDGRVSVPPARESEDWPVLIAAVIIAFNWCASSSSQATASFGTIDVAIARRSQKMVSQLSLREIARRARKSGFVWPPWASNTFAPIDVPLSNN